MRKNLCLDGEPSEFVPEMLALVSYDDDGDVGSIEEADLFGDDNSQVA